MEKTIKLTNNPFFKAFQQIRTLINIFICLLPFAGVAQDKKADSINYSAFTSPFLQKQNTIKLEYANKMNALQQEFLQANKEFYQLHMDAEIGLKAFEYVMNKEKDAKLLEAEFKKFSLKLRDSDPGKKIAQKITARINTEIGQLAMDFTQNDVNGNPVKLSDFKGKFVLLDFWASWCAPCRAENPQLVRVFNRFKANGFTLLGVSLDQDKNKWLEAIQKDGLSWMQVSDLKSWNNAVAKTYGVASIPQNYLIDPAGKIIAENLRGDALYKKVEELLGKELTN